MITILGQDDQEVRKCNIKSSLKPMIKAKSSVVFVFSIEYRHLLEFSQEIDCAFHVKFIQFVY